MRCTVRPTMKFFLLVALTASFVCATSISKSSLRRSKYAGDETEDDPGQQSFISRGEVSDVSVGTDGEEENAESLTGETGLPEDTPDASGANVDMESEPSAVPKQISAKPRRLRTSRHARDSSRKEPVGEQLAILKQKLEQEHRLRLKSDAMAKKLTGVLNRTTSALKKNHKEAEKLRVESVRKAVANERRLRRDAETNVKRLTHELSIAGSHQDGVDPESGELQTEVKQLRFANKKLNAFKKQAQRDLDKLRDHVDEAEAARRSKTEELKKKISEVAQLKREEKTEILALHRKDNATMASMLKHFKENRSQQDAAFNVQKQKAQGMMSALKKGLESLNQTNRRLKVKMQQEELQVRHAENRTHETEVKVKAEEEALVTARKEIAKQKNQLESAHKEMQVLRKQADQLHRAQHQIETLALANAALNHTNVAKDADLETVTSKLEAKTEELRHAQHRLKATEVKVRLSDEAKEKSGARARHLWEDLKQKKAQLQIHDEELSAVQRRLNVTMEQKVVLVKELYALEAKLADIHNNRKEMALVRSQLAQNQELLKRREKELVSMRHKLKELIDKQEDLKAASAKLTTAQAEEKEMRHKLAAQQQREGDEMVTAKAKEQELEARLESAKQLAKQVQQKANEDLLEKDKELKEARDAEVRAKAELQEAESQAEAALPDQQDLVFTGKNGSKAALLMGTAVLRRRSLERELVDKDEKLKSAVEQIQRIEAAVRAKDIELEEVRQALLQDASVQLPAASAQEASAARAALEKINGKADAEERELNATKAELGATKKENLIEQEEMQVLKDDHAALSIKLKKLSAALTKEYQDKQKLNEELSTLKIKAVNAERAQQEMARKNEELSKKNAEVANEREKKEAAAKAAAEKAAVQKAAAERQEAEAKAKAGSGVPSNSDDGDDDDGSDAAGEDSDSSVVATVPWESVQKMLAKNEKFASPGRRF